MTKQTIDHAILTALKASAPYLLPDEQLFADLASRVTTRGILLAEYEERRHSLESRRLIVGQRGEYGIQWKLTDEGLAYCAEKRLRESQL